MQKICLILQFCCLFWLLGCQKDTNISEIPVQFLQTNQQKVDRIETNEEVAMTSEQLIAEIVARRTDERLSDSYQHIFEIYPNCEAICYDRDLEAYFGLTEMPPLDATIVTGESCLQCEQNRTVIQLPEITGAIDFFEWCVRSPWCRVRLLQYF
jgi:hypothetical protein